MKKLLSISIMLMFVCSVAYVCMADSLTTRTTSYKTFHTVANAGVTPDTELAAATAITVGAITGEIDLLSVYGAGSETYANGISVILNAQATADGETVTQIIWGRSDQGPPQKIASIVWTMGLARVDGATATYLWAEHAVVTSHHVSTINVGGIAGGDGVGCVNLDITGFRYIFGQITAESNAITIVTALYRAY